jgi:TetR/AcrR family transcriptional repressor of nem operon
MEIGPMPRTLNLEAREHIVKAAISLFHERGFKDVSMDDVAEAAGIKKANLFHYYPTKEDLGLAAFDVASSRMREKIAERFSRSAGDPIRAVEEMFSEAVEGMRKGGCSRGCFVGNLAQELSDQDEKMRVKIDDHFRFWTGQIADCLERARRSGYFRKDLKPAEAATAILSLLEGATTLCKAEKDVRVLESARHMAVESLRSLRA